MNKPDILHTMLQHRSVRSFKKNTPIEASKLDLIIRSMNQGPTAFNGQLMTVLNITEPELRLEVAKLCSEQQHVKDCSSFLVFVMDFNKAKLACEKQGATIKATDSAESLLSGSVDIGIALGIAVFLAEAQGLYTCAIGAVRNHPEKMAELLNLPPLTVPLVGLCLGYPDSELPDVKPKMPLAGFCLTDKYNEKIIKDALYEYDDVITKPYIAKRNLPEGTSWTKIITKVCSKIYYPEVAPFLKKQGFNKI